MKRFLTTPRTLSLAWHLLTGVHRLSVRSMKVAHLSQSTQQRI